MDIDWAHIGISVVNVIVVGAIFGAGLPLLFAWGVKLWDIGSGGQHADGTITAGSPLAKVSAFAVFALVSLMVIYGVLHITAKSLSHYLGVTLPF